MDKAIVLKKTPFVLQQYGINNSKKVLSMIDEIRTKKQKVASGFSGIQCTATNFVRCIVELVCPFVAF